MNKVAIAAIDLGKHSFHLHAQDDHGHELYHKKFNRVALIQHLAKLEPCTVVMEACGGAHFMAQEVAKLDHTPKLIAPHLVRPYLKSNKNDFADAEAICEAATRPSMRFVPYKTQSRQALALLNSTRDSFIKDRTATANRIHAALLEFGISLDRGFKYIRSLPVLLESSSFPALTQKMLTKQYEHFMYLDKQVTTLDKDVDCQAAEDDLAKRLMTMPGMGPITSTVLAAEIGDGKQFKCGRCYAASIGVVPKQHSTGGNTTLLGISKRGDRNQRRLFVQCARTYMIHLDKQTGWLADWVRQLLARHHSNHVACALANKMARIAWAIAAHHTEFDARPSATNA